MKKIQLSTTRYTTNDMKFIEDPAKTEDAKISLDFIAYVVLIIATIFFVHLTGVLFLKIAHYQPMNFFYNFLFGFGIFTFIAFVIAGIQELTENKGANNVRK